MVHFFHILLVEMATYFRQRSPYIIVGDEDETLLYNPTCFALTIKLDHPIGAGQITGIQ